jgi:hypothetical protein
VFRQFIFEVGSDSVNSCTHGHHLKREKNSRFDSIYRAREELMEGRDSHIEVHRMEVIMIFSSKQKLE